MSSSVNFSTPSSPLTSSDESLAPHGKDDRRANLQLAEVSKVEALLNLQETQKKLEALEAKYEELEESNQAFTEWRDDLEREREEWVTANAKFAKRHLENKVARKALQVKYSAASSKLKDVLEQHSEAREEITRLKDQLNAVLLRQASAAAPEVEQDPRSTEFNRSSGYDQCLALSVQGSLFRVSRRILERDSRYFEELLRSNQVLGDRKTGMTDENPIILDDVEIEEMNDFLTFLHEPPFQTNLDHIQIRQWAAILKLATLWSFDSTRALAITIFDTRFPDEDCFDRLERSLACGVPKWVRPAYDAICRRPESLSADEGRRLGWERYAAICRIREDLARGTLNVPVGTYDHLAHFSENGVALHDAGGSEEGSNVTPTVEDIPGLKDTGVASSDPIDAETSAKEVTTDEIVEVEEPSRVSSEPQDRNPEPLSEGEAGKANVQTADSADSDADLLAILEEVLQDSPTYSAPVQSTAPPTKNQGKATRDKKQKKKAVGNTKAERRQARNAARKLHVAKDPADARDKVAESSGRRIKPDRSDAATATRKASESRRDTARRPPSRTPAASASLPDPPSGFYDLHPKFTTFDGEQSEVRRPGWRHWLGNWGASQPEEPLPRSPTWDSVFTRGSTPN
ncbi:hypothetical protein FRB98_004965 [Tulasnella sp. 332]|nr:hypothetical protein FRB98_004965 [Tulasnella sp. 332]